MSSPSPSDSLADAALIVFAKPPVPGEVKTRLTPALTPADAAHLYEAFLRDALAQYTELDVDVRLYWAASTDAGPDDLVPDSVAVRFQKGANLGERMRNAFRETLQDGAERAVIIGTDHPTLPTRFIEQAFAALCDPESITIGPSADGGYYLLGMNAFYPQLFAGMHYSHDEVFSETLKRAGRTDAQIVVLPRWYDVDTPLALRRCLDDLDAEATAAPHTRRALQNINLDRIEGS
jgi:rSAM/selenodomain-associated transferase 1